METKVIEDILKSHKEFVQKVRKQMELISKGKVPPAEALVKEKEELLARFKERLDAATEAREQVMRRHDEEIRSRKESISHLEKEIKEDKKTLERAVAEAAKRPKEKSKGKTAEEGGEE